MRALSFFLLLTLTACSETTGVNPVVGDESWIALHGAPPGADATEEARITTHLAWVEAKLRTESPATLTPTQRERRAVLLDELHAYRLRGEFPHQATRRGRVPRFVDDEGRHCAVAQLIHASAGPELVEAVRARHEYDVIADMRMPALDAWAGEHGFERRELAMIQPTYDDGGSVEMPSPHEEEEARRRAAAAARVPRDLTSEHVQRVVDGSADWPAMRECAGERTGRWEVRADISVERGLRVRSRVVVTIVAPDGNISAGERDRPFERCLAQLSRRRMRAFIRSANHRFARRLRQRHRTMVEVASQEDVTRALIAQGRTWHSQPTRREALAACMEQFPGTQPARVPLRVMGWNGQVNIRWDVFSDQPLSMPREERRRWHCVQDVLGYARLPNHGIRDYDVDLLIHRDGTLSAASVEASD